MSIKTREFDASEYLGSSQSQAELLADALESGNHAYVANALGTIARARGMTEIARETGLSRESLYKALRANGNPELATVMRVAKALGVTLTTKNAA